MFTRALKRSHGAIRGCRFNSSTSSSASTSPTQHALTLRTLDRLVTSISKTSSQTVSPLAMRTLPSPWLSSSSPNLASDAPTQDRGGQTSESSTASSSSHEDIDPLRPRRMGESYTTFDLPLASDPALLERYVNTTGGIRMGKLLEHLDSLAGAVAYRHCLPTLDSSHPNPSQAFHSASSKAGLYLATASADRLDIFGRLTREDVKDLRFSGFVTWTGNSSMEVVVKMEGAGKGQEEDGWQTLMLGRFAMVCRDTKTQKARKIPGLIVESEEEKALWTFGEEHRRRQKESKMVALDKVPPSSDEAKKLHDLMLQVTDEKLDKLDGEAVVPMKDTEIQTVQLMFPQDRNLHGKVFGGILMRLAFELAFTNAAIFASKPMRFLSLDQITFRLPVPIGAVLRLSSKIVHTTSPHSEVDGEAKAHIMVRAEVEEVETGLRRETNTFFFTMATEDGQAIGRTVIPKTYAEAMHYLEGQRRLKVGDEMRALYQEKI